MKNNPNVTTLTDEEIRERLDNCKNELTKCFIKQAIDNNYKIAKLCIQHIPVDSIYWNFNKTCAMILNSALPHVELESIVDQTDLIDGIVYVSYC